MFLMPLSPLFSKNIAGSSGIPVEIKRENVTFEGGKRSTSTNQLPMQE
jgi:hypothetical protein